MAVMSKLTKTGSKLGVGGALRRLLLSVALVFATYNPAGFSYWHWVAMEGGVGLKLMAGLVLIAVYVALLLATWEVVGVSGAFLVSTVCLGVARELALLGFLDLADGSTVALVLGGTVSIVIGFGMCFSIIFGRLTGIVHTRGVIH